MQIQRGRIAYKGGLGQFADLRWGLGKKEDGGVFERVQVDTPMHTMLNDQTDETER